MDVVPRRNNRAMMKNCSCDIERLLSSVDDLPSDPASRFMYVIDNVCGSHMIKFIRDILSIGA